MRNNRNIIQYRIDMYLDNIIKLTNYNGKPLDGLSYESKLQILLANEKKLQEYHEVQNSKNKGANEVKAMRMLGVTQSYYMYDSQLYKKSKGALMELDEWKLQ